jgi:hypothetical protein
MPKKSDKDETVSDAVEDTTVDTVEDTTTHIFPIDHTPELIDFSRVRAYELRDRLNLPHDYSFISDISPTTEVDLMLATIGQSNFVSVSRHRLSAQITLLMGFISPEGRSNLARYVSDRS